jgi:hypothetical protein
MPLSLAEIFPMSLQGAVFLMTMGAAILIGAVWRSARGALVAVGLAAGLSSFFFTWPLAAPYAPPTPLMWVSLILAIVAQVAALVWAIPQFAPRGKRVVAVAIFTIVGLNFAVMTPAFGWPVLYLAALTTLNSLLAMRFGSYPLTALWATDGALKVGFGALMSFAHLAPPALIGAGWSAT